MNIKLLLFLILAHLSISLSGCVPDRSIQGTVVDFETSEPITDAKVTASRLGWGTRNGSLVWDKVFAYHGSTAKDGEFRFGAQVGSSAEIRVTKESYVPYQGWHDVNQTLHIKLEKQDPDYVPLPTGVLEVGIKNFRPYGWIFSEQRMTFDRNEADLFPLVDNNFNRERITLEASGEGGISFLSVQELGVNSDFLVYADDAPEEGYLSNVTLNLKRSTEGPAGVYFVRTRDGEHFAKFYFGPSGYGILGSEQDYEQGDWGLLIDYVYNPNGSRNLEFQRQ